MSAGVDEERALDRFLTDAVTLLDAGRPVSVTIRDLIAHLGAERRGSRVVEELRAALARFGLETQPDFTTAWIDNSVEIRRLTPTSAEKPNQGAMAATQAPARSAEEEPAITIGSLRSASAEIISVERTESLELARTRMLRHDVSQLAVMSGPRQLVGAVTWESIAIAALGGKTALSAATIPVTPVQFDADLIALIPTIVEHGFVFVLAADRSASGIVTTADLSEQFASLAGPFLLLGEIERRLRRILNTNFTNDELALIVDPNDSNRSIESATDLSLGEVVRFIESPDNWQRLGWPFARTEFIKALHEVRRIRNDVMHFSPDPLTDTQGRALINFVKWLRVIPVAG